MAEKKKLDLRALRDLAQKHLGAGYSKATREQLLVALKGVLGEVAAAPAAPLKKLATKAKEATQKAVRQAAGRAGAKPAKKAAAPEKESPAKKAAAKKPAAPKKSAAVEKSAPVQKPAAEPAPRRAAPAAPVAPRVPVTAFPPRARPEVKEEAAPGPAHAQQGEERRAAEPERMTEKRPAEPERTAPAPTARAERAASAGPRAPTARAPQPPPLPRRAPLQPEEPPPDVLVEGFFLTPEPRFRQTHAEPVGEGFFVARIAGEQAARMHGLSDSSGLPPSGAFDEDLGELPVSYGEDDLLALPRDPHSLFFFWDFSATGTGPAAARAVLRVYDGDRLVREVEFAPETRRFYLHDLPAGRTYRLEAHLITADGAERRVGEARLVTLPGEGPVKSAEVRFLKLPWHLALSRLREYLRDGRAQVEVVQGREAFTAWIRTPLPHSAELYEGIVSEQAGLGEGLAEALGGWRPSPSGQRDLVK